MPSRTGPAAVASYAFIGLLSLVALLSLFIALTGGDAFWALVVHRRTDVEDMKKRLRPEATSVSEEERRVAFIPPGNVIRPYPSVARNDPARPPAVAALLDDMYRIYNTGDLDGSVRVARRMLEQDHESLEALVLIIYANVWKRTHERLLPEFQRGADGPPASVAWTTALGRLYGELGRREEALAAFERARMLNPKFPGLHRQIGFFYGTFAQPRDIKKMIEELRTEIAASRMPGAYHNLAHWYAQLNDGAAETNVWEDYFKEYPLAPIICRHYAFALATSGESDRVRTQVKKCLALSPDDPAEYNDLGLPLMKAGLWEDARAHYAEGVRAYPGANLALGRRLTSLHCETLVELKRPEEAEAACTASIDWGREMGTLGRAAVALASISDFKPLRAAHYYRGLARLMMGRNADADADFTKSIQLEPEKDLNFPFITYFRASARARDRRFTPEDVLRIHRGLPARTPADRLADAGDGFVKWGVFDEAEKRIKAALSLDPLNGRAHAAAVRTLRFQDRLDDAVRAGNDALAKGVDHAFLLHELGHAYYSKGDRRNALDILMKSYAALPQNPGTNVLIARVLESLGREGEALPHWELTGGAADRTHDYLGPNKRPAAAAAAVLCLLLAYMRIRALRAQTPATVKKVGQK